MLQRRTQRFENLWIWDSLGDRLPWYYSVSTNRMPAKYLICRRIPCAIDLQSSDEEALWLEHERLTDVFLDAWKDIRKGQVNLADLPKADTSLMDLSVELVKRMLTHCNFCRWKCRVDRSKGTKHGTCQLESVSRVGSYFHHRGEELFFRGTEGSGTIFFTSCNMRCQFCQNGDISHDKDNGIPMTPQMLALMAWQLRMEGCHNINWVGGEVTIHLHTIVEAISLLHFPKPNLSHLPYIQEARSDAHVPYQLDAENAYYDGEFNVPMLWNSNFFMSPEAMSILRLLTDVWLPDFKFGNDRCSIFLSKTPWYFETVAKNHKLVYDWGEDMAIRHLVMPNHVECCTKPVLEWIAKNTPNAVVNVMDQYHPDYACNPSLPAYQDRYEELSRRPTGKEISEAYRYAKDLGLLFETTTFEKNVLRDIS
ncbi:MAG: radical SAM protein [Candidatus Geothermarchaeales archaeon]